MDRFIANQRLRVMQLPKWCCCLMRGHATGKESPRHSKGRLPCKVDFVLHTILEASAGRNHLRSRRYKTPDILKQWSCSHPGISMSLDRTNCTSISIYGRTEMSVKISTGDCCSSSNPRPWFVREFASRSSTHDCAWCPRLCVCVHGHYVGLAQA